MCERVVLLNPGPVTLSERVRRALLSPDMCHREADFAALTLELRARLGAVYPSDEHVPVLLTGSGTAAVEAMLATLAGPTLVVANGVYGERMAAMLEAHGRTAILMRGAWTEAVDLVEVERRLRDEPAITHVAVVHHETTTGRLNDLDPLAELCARHGRRLLLDAVSSFGGERIDFERWPLDGVAATANKCLHGVPGLAFVVARRDLLEREGRAGTMYLDLRRYHREQQRGFSPFTPSVQACLALREALAELGDEGGWTARRARYRTLSSAIRGALAEVGVETVLDPHRYASMLTSWWLPPGLAYASLHDVLRDAGFVIYAGQGELAGRIFRIATMGDITDDDLARLLDVLPRACRA